MFKGEIMRVPFEKKPTPEQPASLYKCEFCQQMWPSDLEINYHKKKHVNEVTELIKKGEHLCWTCITRFENNEQLINHIKTFHLLTSKEEDQIMRPIYVCNDCHHIFFNKQLLTLHIARTHHFTMGMKKFKCPKCSKSISIRNLWHHFIHHNFCSFQTCKICCTHFPSQDELQTHLSKSHQIHLKCGICSTQFNNKDSYDKHKGKHATCEVDNNMEAKLIERYFIGHTENFSYSNLNLFMGYKLQKGMKVCKLCNEICSTIETCKQHILDHSNYEPAPIVFKPQGKLRYFCSCGEEFLQRILLKQHILRNKSEALEHQDATIAELSIL